MLIGIVYPKVVFVLQSRDPRYCCWDCLFGHCNLISTIQLRGRLHGTFTSNILTFTKLCLVPETCITVSSLDFLFQWLVEYNAALASVCFMILLGFVDDVLDVPWRVYVACRPSSS
jgi:hypothetical protein